VFASRLTAAVSGIVPGGDALDPAQVKALPPGTRTAYINGFADALSGTFWFVAPVLALSVLLALALRETTLRESVHTETQLLVE
jgi:hypothetical protein